MNAALMFLVIITLMIPLGQTCFFKLHEKPLSGDVKLAPDTQFSLQDWFEGSYSTGKEEYLNDNFGFRNTFLRLISQLYYSSFKAVFARDVVPGKDGFLYELKYLQTHAGQDYVGDAEIKSRFEKLKFIQDTLAKKGIHFAILFAPGKATYYPEYIPAPYDKPSLTTNYIRHIEEAKRTGVNYIDFNRLFADLKPAAKYPLYPKTGTHWSVYGMHIAFDTLTRYMERVSSKKLPHYSYEHVKVLDTLQTPDGDIAEGLNLMFDLPHFKMAYPDVQWLDSSNTVKPTVLTVSDSYWMGLYFLHLPKFTFGHHEFWYYNKQLFNYDPEGKTGNPADFDLKASVEKNDFVFIMATEASLKQIGWGFIEDVYSMYKNGPEAYEKMKRERKHTSEVTQTKIAIRNDEKWYRYVVKQAREMHISIDSCVQLNAEYAYRENHKNDPPPPPSPEELFAQKVGGYKNAILSNAAWLKQVAEKAKKLKIPLDSCITMDAKWMAEQELGKKPEPTEAEKAFNNRVEQFKNAIKADPAWLQQVTKKAKEKGISVDSSIAIDARWMTEQELKGKR